MIHEVYLSNSSYRYVDVKMPKGCELHVTGIRNEKNYFTVLYNVETCRHFLNVLVKIKRRISVPILSIFYNLYVY